MLARCCAVLAAALSLAMAGVANARPFTAKDLAMMERVSDPRLSPDSRYVAYNLRSTDWEANKGVNALQLIDRASPSAKAIILAEGEKAPTSPRWSRDGQWLYYLSAKSGTSQVWRVSRDGQVRTQMTALPLDISAFRLASEGQKLLVAMSVLPECPTLACTKKYLDEKANQKASGMLFKNAALNATGYKDGLFFGLSVVNLAQAGAATEAIPLLRNFPANEADDTDFAISRDGRTVYFTSYEPGIDFEEQDTAQIYAVPADGSAIPRPLFTKAANYYDLPSLSPDGKKLLLRVRENWVGGYAYARLMLFDLQSQKLSSFAPGFDAEISALGWSQDGSNILVTAADKGQTALLAIDAATAKVRAIRREGHVTGFDASASGIVYAADSMTAPAQLFDTGYTGDVRQLTHFNEAVLAEAPPTEFEWFSFAGWNDEQVYGWVMKPQNYEPGKKYPVAFLVHGGPHDSFSNLWHYRWNPQLWASMGYAVVAINFHGSNGYGEAFGRSVIGHWGDRPLEDLQKGWAYALAHYSFLDGGRACALGASYGGYMINWMASQWNDPWQCLVSHAGIFDVRTDALVSDDLPGFYIAQHPGQDPTTSEGAEQYNPGSFAKAWKKPMLIIHGGSDFRVSTDQGIAAYVAAKHYGAPAELLIFPDEGHGVSKPQNSVQWYATVEAWMKRWLGE